MGALDNSIQFLPGVGPKRASLLKSELGLCTLGDLIHFYPFRYIDRSSVQPIASIVPDMAYVQILARVTRSEPMAKGGTPLPPDRLSHAKRLSVWVEDGTGSIELVFFRGIRYTYERLRVGSAFLFFGKPTAYGDRLNLVHPEIDSPPDGGGAAAGSLTMTGVYPSTEKLRNAGITGRVMTRMMSAALKACLAEVQEDLPGYVIRDRGLAPLQSAIRDIHFPTDAAALSKAQYRLKFEELFFLQLSLIKQKYVRSRASQGIAMPHVGEAFHKCYNALPYELTGAQKRVIKEIRGDMMSGRQMNRLLQGDVGSGKTLVAVLSALVAVGNGFQACIMAPTEVLAQQHYRNILRYLVPTGVRCALLTGSSTGKERREIDAGLRDGSIGIIIGTHALIEDSVVFRNLGLAVIDEQHRFGVEQRSRLWGKATGEVPPHVLVMTATPIPRTLAMTLYGDLDVSVIDELPPGRKPVETLQLSEGKRPELYRFMKGQIEAGRQAFVVYPLIYESEKVDYQNLENGWKDIVEHFPFPPYKVAIVHGRQSAEDKGFNMDAFAAGRADILVSTTVVEVGVDVPNASVMVIENAERFGLSTLHQLRGRVGRGAEKSFCILMKGLKVSRESQKRIDLMCATEDGFELAEEDMKMRGPGDLEGTQQSGLPIDLKIASLARDGLILGAARDYAEGILSRDPSLSLPENALLREELRKDRYRTADFSKIS